MFALTMGKISIGPRGFFGDQTDRRPATARGGEQDAAWLEHNRHRGAFQARGGRRAERDLPVMPDSIRHPYVSVGMDKKRKGRAGAPGPASGASSPCASNRSRKPPSAHGSPASRARSRPELVEGPSREDALRRLVEKGLEGEGAQSLPLEPLSRIIDVGALAPASCATSASSPSQSAR